MTPMIHGKRKITPYPITILNNPSKRTDLFGYFSNILGVAIRKVMGIGIKSGQKHKRDDFFSLQFRELTLNQFKQFPHPLLLS